MTFPDFTTWQAPWEKAGEELDTDKVKKLVYNLQRSESEQHEKIKKLGTEVEERDTALETYRKAEEEAKRANESELERERREKAELKEQLDKSKNDTARENLLLKVRLEKGLTETQVNRLRGETLDDLLKDADEYLKDVKPQSDEDPEGDPEDNGAGTDEEGNPLISTPKVQSRLHGVEVVDTGDADVDKFLEHRANRVRL